MRNMIIDQPKNMLPDLTDLTLKGAWLNKAVRSTGKDASAAGIDGTATNVLWNEVGGTFTNGDFTFANTAFTTQSYWALEADGWNFYVDNGTTIYKNNVGGASLLVTITATGFTGFTGTLKDIRIYSVGKSPSWGSFQFHQGVPDDSLVLSIQDGTKDLSRYKRDITLNGDVIVGDGIELAGDNDYAELDPEFIEAVSAFTIMFYARSDVIDPRDIQIFKALVDNNRIITRLYIAANGVYDFEVRRTDGTDSNAITTSPFQHKGYIHNALVFNGKANMYINGDFVDDGDVIGDVTPTGGATQYFRIGGSGNTLDGNIKDYKVLLGAKSADWIKNYVEQSKGRY